MSKHASYDYLESMTFVFVFQGSRVRFVILYDFGSKN